MFNKIRKKISLRTLFNRQGFRFLIRYLTKRKARISHNKLIDLFYEDGYWIHEFLGYKWVFNKPKHNLKDMESLYKLHYDFKYTLQKNNTILDIGAGMGEEAVFFSKEVGQHGRIFSIEAHPRTYIRLMKTLKYNEIKNVTAINCAISNEESEVLIEDTGNSLGRTIGTHSGIPVKAYTIDHILETHNIEQVDFLKMNIEGAERLAIEGMGKSIDKIKAMCISCHDFKYKDTENVFFRTKTLVKNFLEEKGFKIFTRKDTNLPYLLDQIWAINKFIGEND